ncbi:type II secretion system protein N [Sphingomonas sp.]|uniref:type II secretion system protein N n=1 Tax=Sphingomonas sp. TaxID=28214 RepID=UPI001D74BF1E|nr:type II secretion system protein N [Sphingomonas sp.]MBX9796317.1 type II secretion system protein N [Sphingomonas sp.]
MRRLVLALVALLLAALVATLPMRLALGLAGVERGGLAIGSVEGSIWGATLTDIRYGPVALGDARAALSPWRLMVGEARLALRASGADLALVNGLWGRGLDAPAATLSTGALFAPLPVRQLELVGLSVRFAGGRCARATGQVSARVDGEIAGIALPQALSGTARCSDGALLLPLASAGGQEKLTLTIARDGTFRAVLDLQPGDGQAAARLAGAGFQSIGSGYRLSAQGRF